MKCGYRIYPSWFRDGDVSVPMREAAALAAEKMNRLVLRIEVEREGEHPTRGYYIDYSVTYSSTASPAYEEIAK